MLFFFGVDFLSLIFIIVYVGAIAILFLFVIMMVSIKTKVLNIFSTDSLLNLLKGVWLYFFLFFGLISFLNRVFSKENYFLIEITNFFFDTLDSILIFGFILFNFLSNPTVEMLYQQQFFLGEIIRLQKNCLCLAQIDFFILLILLYYTRNRKDCVIVLCSLLLLTLSLNIYVNSVTDELLKHIVAGIDLGINFSDLESEFYSKLWFIKLKFYFVLIFQHTWVCYFFWSRRKFFKYKLFVRGWY